jgi:hypothetical protein
MPLYSIIGIFCESIRQEAGGTETLIGIFPDNLRIPAVPVGLPSLAIYVRLNLSADFLPGPVSVRLIAPDGSPIAENQLSADLISKALSDAKATDAPLAGLIARLSLMPFMIPKPGRLLIEARIAGETVICGALNIQLETSSAVA